MANEAESLRRLEEIAVRLSRKAGRSWRPGEAPAPTWRAPVLRLIQGGRSAGCSPREADDAR
ncbi:MAG TPA: hypothetical protein VNK94_13110 [Gaiellaceae bacterium]|nr:hypothetical protein [Gaiellaceae bacterium]